MYKLAVLQVSAVSLQLNKSLKCVSTAGIIKDSQSFSLSEGFFGVSMDTRARSLKKLF